jgi:hypothetical protein
MQINLVQCSLCLTYELPPKNNVRQVTPFFPHALLQPLFKILHCSSQDKKLRGLSPQTDYTNRATDSCQRS